MDGLLSQGAEKGPLLFCENPTTRLTARRWRRPPHTIQPHTPSRSRFFTLDSPLLGADHLAIRCSKSCALGTRRWAVALPKRLAAWLLIIAASAAGGVGISAQGEESRFGTPKGAEGTRIINATDNPLYSGEFRLKGGLATLIGSVGDTQPGDHLDYAGKR